MRRLSAKKKFKSESKNLLNYNLHIYCYYLFLLIITSDITLSLDSCVYNSTRTATKLSKFTLKRM